MIDIIQFGSYIICGMSELLKVDVQGAQVHDEEDQAILAAIVGEREFI